MNCVPTSAPSFFDRLQSKLDIIYASCANFIGLQSEERLHSSFLSSTCSLHRVAFVALGYTLTFEIDLVDLHSLNQLRGKFAFNE